jgi:gliding motility-associated-like protein
MKNLPFNQLFLFFSISFLLSFNSSNSKDIFDKYGLSDGLKFSYIEKANNKIQDSTVKFLIRSTNTTVLFKSNSVIYQFRNRTSKEYDYLETLDSNANRYSLLNLEMSFVNSLPFVAIEASKPIQSKTNYFIGNNAEDWVVEIENYSELHYKNIYKGIDVVYYNNKGSIKYDINIAASADYSKIKLKYTGAKSKIVLNNDGNLIIPTALGDFIEKIPAAYQFVDGQKTQIRANYVLNDDNSVSFELHDYNPLLPVVIDPNLIYSTFIGGSANDYILNGQLVKATNGDIFVTGTTTSLNFPTTPGAFDINANGLEDAFIFKINSTGLLVSTFIGGNDLDFGFGLATDNSGNIYFCGDAWSANHPTTTGTYQPIHSPVGFANGDITVMKFNNNLNNLFWSTFIGGIEDEQGHQLTIGSNGNVYVSGQARNGMPVTNGAYQQFNAGSYDFFVCILNPTGSNLFASTFVGGSGIDRGSGIATDLAGNIYLSGYVTNSFPTTPGAFSTTFNGGPSDLAIAKLNPTASSLIYSTHLGSIGEDITRGGIVVTLSGEVIIAGSTNNPNFPVTTNAYSTVYGGGSFDAFLTKLNAQGTNLVFSTFLGGNSSDIANYMAVSSNGEIAVTGECGNGFPVTPCTYDNTFNGGTSDAFISVFNSTGSTLLNSTYLGGGGNDVGRIIYYDASGIHAFGNTSSFNFPTSVAAYDNTFNGGTNDIFALQMNFTNSLSLTTISTNIQCNSSGSITVTATGGNTASPYTYSINGTNYQLNNIFNGLAVGIYTVFVKDAGGCIVNTSDTISIVANLPIINGIVKSHDCGFNTGSIEIFVQGGSAPFLYSIDGTNFQSSNQFLNLNGGIYNLYIKDANNCQATPLQLVLETKPAIQLLTTFSPATCSNSDGSISASVLNGTAPFQYSTDGINYQFNANFSNLNSGLYLITVKDSNNCIDTSSCRVYKTSLTELFIPTVFTPNADGINDVFEISGIDTCDFFHLFIFNRWGQLLLQKQGEFLSWDGKFKDILVPDGVYYYKLTDNKLRTYSGSISLLR